MDLQNLPDHDDALGRNPFEIFSYWHSKALELGIETANTMALATVSSDGNPSVRMILHKGIRDNQFIFYTNYNSPKRTKL